MLFICPICRGKLNIANGAARCDRGHSYDRAKEGYYNFLVGKGGGVHGDNAEMVAARRAFLEAGYYAPLADRISELCREHIDRGVILDSGCGEGYYTAAVARALGISEATPCVSSKGAASDLSELISAGNACTGGGISLCGFDISKDAVRRAAKRRMGADFAVASAYGMPIADGSVRLVMNVFSPMAIEEVHRVLSPQGKFLMVIPAEDHLFDLKALIYDEPYKNAPADTALSGFRLIHSESLEFAMEFTTGEAIRSLFMMTPYAYRTSKEGRERVLCAEQLKTGAHFLILLYEKI